MSCVFADVISLIECDVNSFVRTHMSLSSPLVVARRLPPPLLVCVILFMRRMYTLNVISLIFLM